MNRIEYLNYVFEGQDITNGSTHFARSLKSSSLEIDTFSFEVRSDDTTLTQFVRNTPMTYYHNGNQIGIFYVQKISRISKSAYRFECTSTVGLLDESYHNGGIYTGQTVDETVRDICAPFPVIVKTNIQNIKLYGWLPIATKRENLTQVLFAIGAALKVDYNGAIRIEGLWDGQAAEISADRMYSGGAVEYATPVTQVIVTEHAYAANSTENVELFNGTTSDGDKITFDEPCYDLVAEGIQITESGANYAIVTSGSGKLTGKKYVHTARYVTKDILTKEFDLIERSDSVVRVENATLVSLVNASAIADRLAEYYSHSERIINDILANREVPGDVVDIYHPYSKTSVPACIEDMDTTISNSLRAKETFLLGYKPAMIEDIVTFDFREVLTGKGTWTVPEGVDTVRAVLIGGGNKGADGEHGIAGGTVPEAEWNNSMSFSSASVPAGKGGNGGAGGNGGKILDITFDVTQGSLLSFSSGTGETADTVATETIFGDKTSASGNISSQGWTDPTTGEIFAAPGLSGIKGGDGGALGKHGESVGEYVGGSPSSKVTKNFYWSSNGLKVGTYQAGGDGGGGAAFGNNGRSPTAGNAFTGAGSGTSEIIEVINVRVQPTASNGGISGGNGANGSFYGCGGQGGHGGSGAGAVASVSVSINTSVVKRCNGYTSGRTNYGGPGGSGGDGADGCVVVFYGKKKTIPHGAFIDKNGNFVRDKHLRQIVV